MVKFHAPAALFTAKVTQYLLTVAYPGILMGGGSTNSGEDRENGDLGAVASLSGVLEAAVIWYKKFRFI